MHRPVQTVPRGVNPIGRLLLAAEADALTRLVATLCGTPLAFLGFTDDEDLHFLSTVGLEAAGMPKDLVAGPPEGWPGTVVIADVTTDPRGSHLHAHPAFRDIRFFAATVVDDRDGSAVGLLGVMDRTPRELSPACREGLECVARQIANRLAWARLSPSSSPAPSQARSPELEAEEMNLLRTLVDQMPDNIYVKDVEGRYLFDNQAHRDFLRARHPEDVVGKTVYDLFPPDVAARFDADDRAVIESGTPLVNREEPITGPDGNTRWVSTTKVPQYDARGQVRGLVAIGRDITLRKRAQDHVQAANEQMQRDLALAGETQASFLPTVYPDVSGVCGGLRFVHHYQATGSVGGDFFTVTPFGHSCAGLFICDVMGHGVQSALIAASLHAVFLELARDDPTPGALLTRMNEHLDHLLGVDHDTLFASACYLRLDMASASLTFANAGHPPPMRIDRDAHRIETLPTPVPESEPALGLVADHEFHTHTVPLSPGQCLVVYTDGLYDAMNGEGQILGISALLDCVERHGHRPAPQLIQHVLDEITRFTGGEAPDDDVCLLAVDVTPPH